MLSNDQQLIEEAYYSILVEGTKSYSAKKAHEGKDIGKPGKNFKKIADKAAKKYGSEEAGKRVAGAVLKKLREECGPDYEEVEDKELIELKTIIKDLSLKWPHSRELEKAMSLIGIMMGNQRQEQESEDESCGYNSKEEYITFSIPSIG